jgi:ParB-like chromosome segregation protein Spo0J
MESYFSDDRGWNPAIAQRNSQAALCITDDLPTTTQTQARTATWQVANLRPHPSYARLGISVSASRLNALLDLGHDAFLFPLIVTSSGIVIDGYARLEVARMQDRTTVECIEYNISEEEALRRLLLCHRPSPGLSPFSRIAMARSLTKSFKEKAFQHQQAGGREKGSSKLAESEKIDVQKEIAAVAGVSVGTLSHALEVLRTGDPEILRALCNGEIKIDRAWRWCKESRSQQRENLKLYRRNRGMERVAERLVARQVKRANRASPHNLRWQINNSTEAVRRLAALSPDKLNSVDVIFIKAPMAVIAISENVAQHLGFREEVPSCS